MGRLISVKTKEFIRHPLSHRKRSTEPPFAAASAVALAVQRRSRDARNLGDPSSMHKTICTRSTACDSPSKNFSSPSHPPHQASNKRTASIS
ncbi:hypothetical protein KC19_9G052700, partial [Ceratodon purpureus]